MHGSVRAGLAMLSVLLAMGTPSLGSAAGGRRTAILLVATRAEDEGLAARAATAAGDALSTGEVVSELVSATDLVGPDEILSALGAPAHQALLDCVEQASCLQPAAASTGASLLLLGLVGRSTEHIRVALQLIEVERWKIQNQIVQQFGPDEPGFLQALPGALDEVLRLRVGSLQLAGPEGASVFVDGRPAGQAPRIVDGLFTGEHEVRVEQRGFLPWQGTVTVKPGAMIVLVPTLAPLQEAPVQGPAPLARPGAAGTGPGPDATPGSSPSSLKTWGFVALGLGALLGGTGAVLNWLALDRHDTYHDATLPGPARLDAKEEGQRYWTAAEVSYGAALAAAGTGAVLLWLGRAPAAGSGGDGGGTAALAGPRSGPRLSLGPHPGGLVLTLSAPLEVP